MMSGFSQLESSSRNVDTLAEAPQSALSGVARVLVHAGKLGARRPRTWCDGAKERRVSFISAVIAAGAVFPG